MEQVCAIGLLNIDQYFQSIHGDGSGGVAFRWYCGMMACHTDRGRGVAWGYHHGRLHYVSLGTVGEVGEVGLVAEY